jgi:hypothetical protein
MHSHKNNNRKQKALNTPNGSPFTESYQVLSPSTVVGQVSLLTDLLKTTGVLSLYPQSAHPVWYGLSTPRLEIKIRVRKISIMLRAVGSEGTLIATGDLHNTVRVIAYQTSTPFQSTNVNALTGVDSFINPQYVKKLYVDHFFSLPSQAFSPGSYNVPQIQQKTFHFYPNRVVKCFSTNAANTVWDTEDCDFIFELVSDSLLSPNPTLYYSVGVYYDVID